MTDAIVQKDGPKVARPLRVWPGAVAVALLWLARFGVKEVIPGFHGFALGAQGGLIGAGLVVLWWAFLSRARWFDRLGGIGLMVAAVGASWVLRHESMGPFWVLLYAIPALCLAFVAAVGATRRLPDGRRRAVVALTILAACGVWTLARTEGISGDHAARFHWRWTESPEERLLAHAGERPAAVPSAPAAGEAARETTAAPARPQPAADVTAPAVVAGTATASAVKAAAEWPGFRGPGRDSIVRAAPIETNWSASPPVELWRRPVGPGWSSFAVHGDRLYTQEQRGEHEVVACYDTATGAPVWTHRDPARFFESNGGAGPRGTPALAGGRVYALGATGILNALDARDGAVVWSRNAASDAGAEVPTWGFSSSPLVVEDLVVVAAGGQLAAYDLATGEPRWSGPKGGVSYSSPHRLTIGGVAQVLLMSGAGATSVAPADGTVLWTHPWPGFPIVQPAQTPDGDVVVTASGESGTRRLAVGLGAGGWTVEERWTSRGLKPYFSDFVLHQGHAFGFDGRILSCIDLRDGRRKWKGGRYGNGQLVLLPAQDLLLVLSDEGELALVAATSEAFEELARVPAIQGKTWNHPVLAGNVLFVRNGEEMVALRLAGASR